MSRHTGTASYTPISSTSHSWELTSERLKWEGDLWAKQVSWRRAEVASADDFSCGPRGQRLERSKDEPFHCEELMYVIYQLCSPRVVVRSVYVVVCGCVTADAKGAQAAGRQACKLRASM